MMQKQIKAVETSKLSKCKCFWSSTSCVHAIEACWKRVQGRSNETAIRSEVADCGGYGSAARDTAGKMRMRLRAAKDLELHLRLWNRLASCFSNSSLVAVARPLEAPWQFHNRKDHSPQLMLPIHVLKTHRFIPECF